MSVIISGVTFDSPCLKKGIKAGFSLVSVNGHDINDVLDYRFYGCQKRLRCVFASPTGETVTAEIKTNGDVDALGLKFATYLMDKQKVCRNKCIFCFVDQMPKGLRKSLYFKDDDARLSFFFGNYITLTNMTERDAQRLAEMHISPINISIHTMNPSLRVKMMNNPDAGRVLEYIDIFVKGGLDINTQFVLCPGINDGDELRFSLNELLKYGKSIVSAAVVPVGLTSFREGLSGVRPYTAEEAAAVVELTDEFNMEHYDEYGRNFVYASDEFFLKAERDFPDISYYDSFPQLDNGVGMCALTGHEFREKLKITEKSVSKKVCLITGVASSPLINELSREAEKKIDGLKIDVKTIINDFFGHMITVSGLVTGGDIASQAGNLSSYDKVIIPSVMLKSKEEQIFLDDMTLSELENRVCHKISVSSSDGEKMLAMITEN